MKPRVRETIGRALGTALIGAFLGSGLSAALGYCYALLLATADSQLVLHLYHPFEFVGVVSTFAWLGGLLAGTFAFAVVGFAHVLKSRAAWRAMVLNAACGATVGSVVGLTVSLSNTLIIYTFYPSLVPVLAKWFHPEEAPFWVCLIGLLTGLMVGAVSNGLSAHSPNSGLTSRFNRRLQAAFVPHSALRRG